MLGAAKQRAAAQRGWAMIAFLPNSSALQATLKKLSISPGQEDQNKCYAQPLMHTFQDISDYDVHVSGSSEPVLKNTSPVLQGLAFNHRYDDVPCVRTHTLYMLR